MHHAFLSLPSVPPDVGKQERCLGSPLPIAGSEQLSARLLELLFTLFVAQEPDLAVAKHELAALGIVSRRQRERVHVVVLSLRERVERGRPVSRLSQRDSRAALDRGDVETCGPRELERALVVMRDRLGVVFGTAERLDPLGGSPVLLRAISARDLAVRDVADERVLEGELALAGDRRATGALDELLALERVQSSFERSFAAANRYQPAEPEHLADYRRILEQRLLHRRKRVEPRGDDPLHVLGERQLLRVVLVEHAHELLGVERIAAGTLEERRLRLRRQ